MTGLPFRTADVVVVGAGVQGASLAFHLARRGVAVARGRAFVGRRRRHRALVRVRAHALRPRPGGGARLGLLPVLPRLGGAGGGRATRGSCGPGSCSSSRRPSRTRCAPTWPPSSALGSGRSSWARTTPRGSCRAWSSTTSRWRPTSRTPGMPIRRGRPRASSPPPAAPGPPMPRASGSRVSGWTATGWWGSRRTAAGSTHPWSWMPPAPGPRSWRGPPGWRSPSSRGATTPRTSDCRPGIPPDIPIVIDHAGEVYFRPEGRDLLLVGLETGNDIGGSPDRPITGYDPGIVEPTIERVCRRIPWMAEGDFRSANGGQDGMTPDQRAILGPAGPEGSLAPVRLLRHGLQDRAGDRGEPGRVDPGRASVDGGHHAVRAGAVRRGPPDRGRAPVRVALALTRALRTGRGENRTGRTPRPCA